MSEELAREQLYELVWAKPIATVAEKLSLSTYRLAKRCRNLNIPTPTMGHWTKLAHGKQPRRPPLPPASVASSPEVHHSQWPREVGGPCERAQLLLAELTGAKPNYEGLQSLEDRNFPRIKVTTAMIEPAVRLFHALPVAVEPQSR